MPFLHELHVTNFQPRHEAMATWPDGIRSNACNEGAMASHAPPADAVGEDLCHEAVRVEGVPLHPGGGAWQQPDTREKTWDP